MRKVRQDGGIQYHVNVLQAMVSFHYEFILSATYNISKSLEIYSNSQVNKISLNSEGIHIYRPLHHTQIKRKLRKKRTTTTIAKHGKHLSSRKTCNKYPAR